jgi:hypothetical protein
MTTPEGSSTRKPHAWRRLLAGVGLVIVLVLGGSVWPRRGASQSREAPEADAILNIQATMPFQVLIPAYLPAGFAREEVEIQTDRLGPQGEAMVRLIYTHRRGITVTISEWVPHNPEGTGPDAYGGANEASASLPGICTCMRGDTGLYDSTSSTRVMVTSGPLRVLAETSHPEIVLQSLLRAILLTLSPASGLEVTTALEEAVSTYALPPAVPVPVNAEGVQEVVLVVSPSGYTPAHFAVRSGIPVRLVFRQLGYVGCGNELYVRWGPQQQGYLILSSPSDTQVLEFTPEVAGTFAFNCSHLIYQGAMTVEE